jgi:4-hydroxy 2-oxovalerate aldolase
MTKKILISDPTLRDGNHAIGHQLAIDDYASYCIAAEVAGVPIVEVGHGNGLGASSMLVGESKVSDEEILKVCRNHLKKSKLAVHVIPGFSTINEDLSRAVDLGVDIFRVGSHCTEADTTHRHISFLRNSGRGVFGVLMMSHMASSDVLIAESKKMQSFGAQAIIIMDSAGAYLPNDVFDRVSKLVDALSIPVGFHAHNNLGMAVSNSLSAVEAGASIIDGSIRGFGAGAGNCQLEVLVAVLHRLGFSTGIDLYKILDAAELAGNSFNLMPPFTTPISIISGLSGVFSGFSSHVKRIAEEYNVDPRDVFFELGERKAVAGQESLIIDVARILASRK